MTVIERFVGFTGLLAVVVIAGSIGENIFDLYFWTAVAWVAIIVVALMLERRQS
jgi:hypothetical protein